MDITGTRVLLVEDDVTVSMVETKYLTEYGCDVSWVETGEEAVVRALGPRRFDVILMDIHLGAGLDGTDAARRILESSDVPIIFLSSHTEKDFVERTEDITSYGYVVKNSGPTVLISSVKMALRLHESKRLLQRKVNEVETMLWTLKRFILYSPAAVAMFDTEMRYLAVSRQFCADYNLGDIDPIGKSHYEIFPEIPERWKAIHRRCLEGNTDSREIDPFPRADGTIDYVRWEINPWYYPDGTIGGIILSSMVVNKLIERYRNMDFSP